jgi:hypothetical protein
VRVPIPVVILLVFAVVGGVWWKNTRNMDFMTPPSESRLEEIRVKTESSFPRADQTNDAISVPVLVKVPEPPPRIEPPKPPLELGDFTVPPTLQAYAGLAPQGAEHLIEVARALEEKGEFQRALLAWERVLDRTKPDESQMATAVSAIRRLRPTLPDWNQKPETSIHITLQAGTGKKFSKPLTKALETVARDLETASSGILKVKANVTVGKSSSAGKGPVPVALWITGSDKKTSSTEVVSFTTDSPDVLHAALMKTLFQLVRSNLGKTPGATPPAALAEGENPADALGHRVTRLGWSELATALNLPAKKTP